MKGRKRNSDKMKMMRLENSQSSRHVTYATKRGMTGGVPPHPLVVHQGVVSFGILISGKSL